MTLHDAFSAFPQKHASEMAASGAIRVGPSDVRRFIQEDLPLTVVPVVPEIRLHRAGPSSGLRRLGDGDAPYWAFPWPGGAALARHVLDLPEVVAGRRVLDLGAGGGLVALAAARAGAGKVIAAETDPIAAVALALNATVNGVALTILRDDLTAGVPPDVDIVLAGDLFYARPLARRVTAFLDRCRAAGLDVLVGDIGRAFLPLPRLRRAADYSVAEVGVSSGAAAVTAGVFEWRAEGDTE